MISNALNLKQNCNYKSILAIKMFRIKNNLKLKQIKHFNKNIIIREGDNLSLVIWGQLPAGD